VIIHVARLKITMVCTGADEALGDTMTAIFWVCGSDALLLLRGVKSLLTWTKCVSNHGQEWSMMMCLNCDEYSASVCM
jgi:hypothetical protein